MATGTGNLPNPGMSFSPFAILTAEEQNNLVENIESLATGTGIGDGAIGTVRIANDSVTASKTSFGGSYSLTEVNTGFTWVDGKVIYKKTIDFGALPNNTTKSVNHGITGLDNVIDTQVWARRTSDSERRILPYLNTTTISNQYAPANISNTQVSIISGANLSSYDVCFYTLYYTKV